LSIACIVVCAGLLAACDKGPDTEKTKLELVTKTEPEGETVEESKKKLPEASREETKPEEQTESSYNAREARTRMLSERVLVLFANQCLDLYYSDSQLMEYETVDNKSGISVAPGSSLYYRIDSYAYDDIYQSGRKGFFPVLGEALAEIVEDKGVLFKHIIAQHLCHPRHGGTYRDYGQAGYQRQKIERGELPEFSEVYLPESEKWLFLGCVFCNSRSRFHIILTENSH
jgi:hypothetical protein